MGSGSRGRVKSGLGVGLGGKQLLRNKGWF